MLHPLLLNINSKVVGGGDAYEYLWKLWWFKHSLLELGQSPWLVPHIAFPEGFSLAYGESTTANTFFAIPLTYFLGEIITYNLLILSSTILSGFTMFLLARQVSRSFWAGLLAGTIFAFSSFRFVQLVHLNIATTQWFPLIFYFLEKFADTHRRRYGLLAGIAFAFNALASWYYAVAGGTFVLVWSLVRFWPLVSLLRRKKFWQAILLFGISAVILVLPAAWPYVGFLSASDIAIPMENSNFYSASFTDYLLPSPVQFLWGNWVSFHLLRRLAPGEFILGWGFMAWLFAIYCLRFAAPQVKRPWIIIVLIALVLSFGLSLHIAGRQVIVPAPEIVVNSFNNTLNTISMEYSRKPTSFSIGQSEGVIIPMPALLLRWFVPIFGEIRTWTRFGVIALFGVAVLSALGATAWYRREITFQMAGKKYLVWGGVLGLTLFELWWKPVPLAPAIIERPIDVWLAEQPGEIAIIEYPLASAFRPEQFLYSRIHGKSIVHGYTTYFSFVFSRQYPELVTFPNIQAVRKLGKWGVRYILIETKGSYAEESQGIIKGIERIDCLYLRTVQDTVYVFELFNC